MILNMFAGEQKILTFIVKDSKDNPVPLTNTDLLFIAKDDKTVIEKDDDAFDRAQEAQGIIKLTLLATNWKKAGNYRAQLQITFPNGEIDKSEIIEIYVRESVI